MSEPRRTAMERLHELLAELEIHGLDAAGRAELDALLASDLASVDAEAEGQRVAEGIALVHAALVHDQREELPDVLRERILAGASRHFGWDAEASTGRAGAPAARRTAAPARRRAPSTIAPSTRDAEPRAAWFARTGWLVAAAAAVALAVVLTRPDPLPPAPESRDAFMARVGDEIVVPWTPTEDPLGAGVTGDVVWSPTEQKGFMRFRGLSVNDPAANQYQLWIIDAERAGEDPVDGGVFDCNADGEVVVPIDAKLLVGKPAAFAVTLEKPGGVVVSKQEHLFLLAAVP